MNSRWILIGIVATFAVIMIAMFCYQWVRLEDNLARIRHELAFRLDSLSEKKKVTPLVIDIKPLPTDKKLMTIDAKEVQKINAHIDALTAEVRSEALRAESIIEKDLDRLNLFMTVGIGFMAMLGVFVPLFANIVSGQDLRDQTTELRRQQTRMGANVNRAQIRMNQVTQSIQEIDNRTNMTHLRLCNVSLQHAVGRFYNVGNVTMLHAVGDRRTYMEELFANLKRALTACQTEQGHQIAGDFHFAQSVSDLQRLFNSNVAVHTVFPTRGMAQQMRVMETSLENLKNSTPVNETANYEMVFRSIDAVIRTWTNG